MGVKLNGERAKEYIGYKIFAINDKQLRTPFVYYPIERQMTEQEIITAPNYRHMRISFYSSHHVGHWSFFCRLKDVYLDIQKHHYFYSFPLIILKCKFYDVKFGKWMDLEYQCGLARKMKILDVIGTVY